MPKSNGHRAILAGLVAFCLTQAGVARAGAKCPARPASVVKARAAAKSWFVKGTKHYKTGKVPDALAAFTCARRMVDTGYIRYWVGRSAQASGKHKLALEMYAGILPSLPRMVDRKNLLQRIASIKTKLPRKIVSAILARVRIKTGPVRPKVKPPRMPRCPGIPASVKQARKLARTWFMKGVGFTNAGHHAHALAAFKCTQRLLPARLTKYWIGRSAEAANRLDLAVEVYTELLRTPPRAVTVAQLKKKIARMRWVLSLEQAAETLPPEPPRPDSGARAVPVPRPRIVTRPSTVPGPRPHTPGIRKTVVSAKLNAMQKAGWALAGVSASLLAVGAGLGVTLAIDRSKIENASSGTWWDPDLNMRAERKDALTISMAVCLGAGAALAATATTLLVLGHKKERQATVSFAPAKGGGLAVVRGEF